MFLDTARLGLMSPGAQRAQVDLARLAGAEAASPRFERFLLGGFDDPAEAARYPGLDCWRGVGHLKDGLRVLAGGRPYLPVLLATRSTALMRLAARLLFGRCRNVLTTDLSWPGYYAILASEAARASRVVTVVPLLDDVLAGRAGADEVVGRLCGEYLGAGCDGVFLPAVSSHGVRVPAERVSRILESVREPRLVVLDGAQEFCHVPADLGADYCDLYIAGAHKWLGAYHPLGLGFYGRPRSRSLVETTLAHLLATGELDDALLRFTSRLETGDVAGVDETVDLAPLFTCQGAAGDFAADGADRSLATRLANAEVLA